MDALIKPANESTPIRNLVERLKQSLQFEKLGSAVRSGIPSTISGVWGSSCALVASVLAEQVEAPTVVVLDQGASIDAFMDAWKLFSDRPTLAFPPLESEPGELVLHDELLGERLRILKQLSDEQDPHGVPASLTVVTSIQALMQPVISRQRLTESTRRYAVGEALDVAALARWLTQQGYQHVTAVELPGEFSVRGGILDLFALDWDQPLRVELFDTEIDSIRSFDIGTQRSSQSYSALELTSLGQDRWGQSSLTDYLPSGTLIIQAEPEAIAEAAVLFLQRVEHPDQYHSWQRVQSDLQLFAQVLLSPLGQGTAEDTLQLSFESIDRFSGEVARIRDELDRLATDREVIVIAETAAEVERLQEVLQATDAVTQGRLAFTLGTIDAGFHAVREGVLVLSGNELFARSPVRRTIRRHLGRAIDSFMELSEGDLVVHLSHGIGRFRGMQLVEREGNSEEHMVLEFQGGTRIYVPAAKIELVQKYIGGTKTRPKLAKIGGKTWLRQKQAAETAVQDMAVDLLDLQAKRASRPGISFSTNSDWQREFEASFPYLETPDQLSAIEAVRVDMFRPQPMDRLLCGDVGFGKTEVAMRAAFRAVDNGYQVAVLVPTTILAEQHYHTFQQRLSAFPFDIGKLSRFCSTAEQKETMAGLKSGRVDIVIGTHRLASKDVQFMNLGLVIIDEEQRFGVAVKERLKHLRSVVDVLTLSATPIPRTLHMSLVGVRDISNLETPPEERVAVETKVTRFNPELIRHAIMRELARGGQTYFVHNRVEDIEVVASKLRNLVPEASIRIGHGQMPEGQLEKVMVDFVAHRFDILLATTIVESGLDIPNANTIFIDEADRYGLADLHQLRGRVGRYNRHAYCYLLVDPHKHVTPNAAKRLRAIEEYSEMGAGFAIAMRDLEIRGAGNLLGTQQSGHIAAVGYELYCQLLEKAVRQLQNKPAQERAEVDITLPVDAYLPTCYVEDYRTRIDLYRRLARVTTPAELEQFQAELVDRFGELPDEVSQLLRLAELRLDAARWQISAIFVEDSYLVLRFLLPERAGTLKRILGNQLRLADPLNAYVVVPEQVATSGQSVDFLKSLLRSN